MSQWTHVSGILRLNELSFLRVSNQDREYKGREFQRIFEDGCPEGSEGSLRIDVQYTGDCGVGYTTLHWGNLVLSGDLRDYGLGEAEEIPEWLDRSTGRLASLGTAVRSGYVGVEVEFNDTIVYRFNQDTGGWEEFARVPYEDWGEK